GIRDRNVTGVQTCALPIFKDGKLEERDVEVEVQQEGFPMLEMMQPPQGMEGTDMNLTEWLKEMLPKKKKRRTVHLHEARRILIEIGRASCRERVEERGGGG